MPAAPRSSTAHAGRSPSYGYEGATVAKLEEATGLLARRDLPLLREQGRPVRRGRDGNELPLRRHPPRGPDSHEAFRALAAESPEWLAVLIETEGRMRHDEDFVRRFEAKAGRRRPAHPRVVRAAAGSGEVPRRRLVGRDHPVHDRTPQRPRSARRRRRPVRHRRDAAAARRRDRPKAKARAQGQAAGSRSVAARLTSAAPAATDDERDLGAAGKPAAA